MTASGKLSAFSPQVHLPLTGGKAGEREHVGIYPVRLCLSYSSHCVIFIAKTSNTDLRPIALCDNYLITSWPNTKLFACGHSVSSLCHPGSGLVLDPSESYSVLLSSLAFQSSCPRHQWEATLFIFKVKI